MRSAHQLVGEQACLKASDSEKRAGWRTSLRISHEPHGAQSIAFGQRLVDGMKGHAGSSARVGALAARYRPSLATEVDRLHGMHRREWLLRRPQALS